ncbi:hypothetical protein LTR95_012340, partial [Oleoguttula sp. CCFEE 5521]
MEDSEKAGYARERALSPHSEPQVLKTGSLAYITEQGNNGAESNIQEASGAPVESRSPFRTGIQYMVNHLIPQHWAAGSILTSTGSVGVSLMFWLVGFVVSMAGLSLYLGLASYFPARSGAEVVYLEQAFPRPRYSFPVAFAVQSVLLSFSSSNAIVLAQYIFRVAGHTATLWEQKGVAVAGYTVVTLLGIYSNRLSFLLSDIIGFIKVFTLIFISITGLVVLGGHTSVKDPHHNFRDPFAGTTGDGNGLATALVRITFAYAGYQNCFNVMNEVKDPIRTMKRIAPLSLLVIWILYMLCNVAYFAAVPKEEIAASKTTAASLFFSAVFGTKAAKGLNILVILSALGNLITDGQSRVIREIGRQGVLPYPKFWVTTKPFGTPIGPYVLKWSMTVLMILASPAGDAFNFVVDLQNYPDSAFLFLMSIGLYFIRDQ